MKKIVLYACFLLLLMITNYAQTVTFDASITKATARMYVSTETIYFDFNSQHDLGMHNIAQYESNDWRSFYKVSFGEDIPVFSSIKSIELISFITEMEYSPNDFVVNIKKVPNTTNFEHADSLFGSIGYPYEPMKYYEYGDTLSENIKTFITPQDFADSFFIIGVYDNEMYNNSKAVTVIMAN